MFDFIIYHHAPYRSAFEFDTLDEYEEHVRSVELRTLSGDLVKSFEELEDRELPDGTRHRVPI